MDSKALIQSQLSESAGLKLKLAETYVEKILQMADSMFRTLESGGKVLFCGNGGSAADSQHLAAELLGRFKRSRKGLPALALTTDTSMLTSISNDFGFETVFSRQVEALGKSGDMLVGISTSGRSPNVLRAMERAKQIGLHTVALIGNKTDAVREFADIIISIPSDDTARIQECHITIGHIVCDLVESRFSETL